MILIECLSISLRQCSLLSRIDILPDSIQGIRKPELFFGSSSNTLMLSGCLISINEPLSRKVIFKKPNIKNLNLYQSINQNVESRHPRLTSVNLLQIKLTIWSQSTATIQTDNIIMVCLVKSINQ